MGLRERLEHRRREMEAAREPISLPGWEDAYVGRIPAARLITIASEATSRPLGETLRLFILHGVFNADGSRYFDDETGPDLLDAEDHVVFAEVAKLVSDKQPKSLVDDLEKN